MKTLTILVHELDAAYSLPRLTKNGRITTRLVAPLPREGRIRIILVGFHIASEKQKTHALLLARNFPQIDILPPGRFTGRELGNLSPIAEA